MTFKEVFIAKVKEQEKAVVVTAIPDQCVDCADLRNIVNKWTKKYNIHNIQFEHRASLMFMNAFNPPPGNLNIYAFNSKGEVTQLYGAVSGARLGIFNAIISSLGRPKTFSEQMYGLWLMLRDTYKNFRLGRTVFTSKKLSKERLDKCLSCPFYSKDQKRCTDCGCFVYAKVKFQASSCPQGKW